MSPLFFGRSEKDLSLIFDIQSGVVRATLFSGDGHSKPHIVYISSQILPYKTKVDGTYLATTMLKAVGEVASQILHVGFPQAKSLGYTSRINRIHYVMSSPWVVSESKTVKIDYDKDTEITESTIRQIINKSVEDSIKKEEDLIIVEKKIFDVRLNGYSVENYRNKKTKKLEVSFAVTTGSKYVLDKIEGTVEKTLGKKKEDFHSCLLLQYTALRSIFSGMGEYISIHIHSELTDIVVVKRGISSYLASFPFGTISLLRKISTKMKNSEETATSLLSLYQSGNLEAEEKKRFEKVLDPIMEEWQNTCLTSLGSIREKMAIPRLVYLSAHSNFELFKKNLKDTKFEIIEFDSALVDKYVVFEKGAGRSTLLGMYSLSLNNML